MAVGSSVQHILQYLPQKCSEVEVESNFIQNWCYCFLLLITVAFFHCLYCTIYSKNHYYLFLVFVFLWLFLSIIFKKFYIKDQQSYFTFAS